MSLQPLTQVLMGHALPLLERMSQPSDIAIVNFGAWHGSGDGADYQKLVTEFANAVAEKRESLPHFVWKEMVPTHYDQQHGLYPGETSLHEWRCKTHASSPSADLRSQELSAVNVSIV